MSKLEKFPWTREDVYKGCLLASIAHAIMVSHYPDLSSEQSWDGMNYNVQDSMGIRGTITFGSTYCTAAFRDDKSERVLGKNKNILANEYFKGAPLDIRHMAERETLQYLLENESGTVTPLISTGFWGGNVIYSIDTKRDFMENGGGIIETQLKRIEEGVEEWKNYYGMTPKQYELFNDIFNRIITYGIEKVFLSANDITRIECNDAENLEESKISFEEIGIMWE